MRSIFPIRSLLVFLLLQVQLAAASATIPDVHFSIVRLDLLTYEIKSYYEFSQPYRKSLPDSCEETFPYGCYTQVDDIFYTQTPAIDFGYTTVKSRLTGQLLVHASTVWAGSGGFEYPPDSLSNTGYAQVDTNPDPDTLIFLPLFGGSQQQADSAWLNISNTDIISRLAASGAYEIFIFDHFYSVGEGDPNTAEWIIIGYTTPPAPDDVAIRGFSWPKSIMTRNVATIPEMNVHNFGDFPVDLSARLTLAMSSGLIYESTQLVTGLPADSSRSILFDPATPSEQGLVMLDARLLMPDGSLWSDAYPVNDEWHQELDVTHLPVFKPVSSIKNPGAIPVRGVMLDFDGDGDQDVFQYGYQPKLWQNDGTGNYADITEQTNISLPMHPREVLAVDFTGDGHPDIIIVYYERSPIFLRGDGTGAFRDFTDASGLSGVTGYWDVESLDLENDGDWDLIFQAKGQEVVLENDGAGHFSDVTVASGIVDPSQTEHVACGDLNNDGYPDVVLTNWNAPPTVFINDGRGKFLFMSGPWDFQYGRMALVVDYNNDGFQDILFSRQLYADHSLLFKNLGNQSFELVSSEAADIPPSFHVDAADIDGNGWPDLLLEGLDTFTILTNQGGSFTDNTRILVGMAGEMVVGALGTSPQAQFIDLDGDGDLDIYSQMVVFENQGRDPSLSAIADRDFPIHPSHRLHQNYPNPFNPTTTIDYSLSGRVFIRLVVVNLLGQEVRTLAEGVKSAGTYTVEWDGNNKSGERLSSGIYFYRLQTPRFIDAHKMLLLR